MKQSHQKPIGCLIEKFAEFAVLSYTIGRGKKHSFNKEK